MDNTYLLLKAIHILLVALWLGTDIGTFASFRRMRDAKLEVPTRQEMSRLSDLLDMGPRSALVLLLMFGIYMTNVGGWGLSGTTGEWLARASLVIGVLWCAGVWHQYWVTHARPESPRPAAHVRFQKWFRLWLAVAQPV